MPTNIFNSFDDPSAPSGTTQAFGVNDAGQTVGYYDSGNGNFHGFLLSGGTYTAINGPVGASSAQAFGVNATGQIAGEYFDNLSDEHGFFLSGGVYTTIDDPLTGFPTHVFGLNDMGEIVGYSGLSGFLYIPNASNGIYTSIDAPNSASTVASGINNEGQIVGYYQDGTGGIHGFILSGSTFTILNDPLATNGTKAFGINDAGQVVGTYDNATGTHAFLYSGGAYTTIDDPAAGHTLPMGSTTIARSSGP